MAFGDLREFIGHLDKQGWLRRVSAPVSRDLEIAEITDRVSKSAGARNVALLFENVRGSDMPVLINAFGSSERIAAALGAERLDDLGARVAKLLELRMPGSMFEKLRKLGDLFDLAKAGPKRVRSAPCQEVVVTDHPSLAGLPILKCWPGDGGRYITLPMVFTRDPATGARNVGMYRLQVYDDQTLGMHWQIHKGSAEHQRVAEERREPMEVAIALGGPPAAIYAGSAPLPPGVDEMVFAGWLRGAGVPMVPCRTVHVDVPAEAEIVLEGWVDPAERRVEGPFGDHTGYYSLAREYPVFHLKAITHRKNPIYPTTIVGKPPMEDYFLGKATERIFLPLLKMLIPDIVDYSLPISGVFHNCAFVKIKKEYPFQARRVMHAIWGAGQMAFTKFIVVVDEHVNVHDEQDVMFHLYANCDPARDTEVVHGPVDILDHASPDLGAGSKMGFDATVKLPAEGKVRAWPKELEMDAKTKALVTRRWKEYGLG